MLKHKDGFVMKPVQNNTRGKTEIEFYEQIMNSPIPILSQLQNLIPRFLGLHQFVSDGAGTNSCHFYSKEPNIVLNKNVVTQYIISSKWKMLLLE